MRTKNRGKPRWMWDGVAFGYDPGVNTSDTSDAITMMIQMADLKTDWQLAIIDELMPKYEWPVTSVLKSPIAIRQVHPEVRWG